MVVTTEGRHLSWRVEYAKGTMENPLTPEELHRKYLKLATTVTSAAHAERIADVVRRIEQLENVHGLAVMLRSLKPAADSAKRRAKPRTTRSTAKGGGAR